MATTIKIKSSTVNGKVPTTLAAAELAVNLTDQKLYTADASGNVFELGTTGEVTSVNGQVGIVSLNAASVGAATTAQGALADSALQPSDNVSQLTNDAGYLTSSTLPPGQVSSVNGQTGTVVLDAAAVSAATAAQGALADTAVQPGIVNPVFFANQAAFPSAVTYHGGVAHSHADGAMFFAHGGAWKELANASDYVPLGSWSALPVLP